jgi:hypothetical protein
MRPELSMHRWVIAGMAVFLAVAGCVPMKPNGSSAAPDVPPSSTAPPKASAPPAPPAPPEPPAPPVAAPVPPESPAPPSETSAASAAPAASPAKPKVPADSRPVKQAGAAPAALHAAAAPAAPAGKPPPPAAPTLNLADLEQRLRDTRAIGVFTKLSLKNQVDDLLGAFRDLYKGPNKQPPAELRQRYDQLLVKVLALLQQGDPPLAQAIASSREAIWSILADPDQFAKI